MIRLTFDKLHVARTSAGKKKTAIRRGFAVSVMPA
jgi:hypothetical protein